MERMIKLEKKNSQDEALTFFYIISFQYLILLNSSIIPLPGILCRVPLFFSLVFLSAQRSLQTDPAPSYSRDCTS